jgi:hypothetical protein
VVQTDGNFELVFDPLTCHHIASKDFFCRTHQNQYSWRERARQSQSNSGRQVLENSSLKSSPGTFEQTHLNAGFGDRMGSLFLLKPAPKNFGHSFGARRASLEMFNKLARGLPRENTDDQLMQFLCRGVHEFEGKEEVAPDFSEIVSAVLETSKYIADI